MLQVFLSVLVFQILVASIGSAAETPAAQVQSVAHGKITLTLREVDITEVMEMLSRKQRVNILLADGVDHNAVHERTGLPRVRLGKIAVLHRVGLATVPLHGLTEVAEIVELIGE